MKYLSISILLLINIAFVHAQHEHHSMQDTSKKKMEKKDINSSKEHMNMDGMDSSIGSSHPLNMSHAFSLNLPMTRNGSGTAWLPDSSPMYAYMFHSPKWMYMVHGNVFVRYINQDFTNKGSRGKVKLDVPNWFMFMGQRKVGKNGLFHFNTMFSLDAALVGGRGYPLLFQSGEAYEGRPIVDRQHPHDLFSELSVSYTQALSNKTDVFVYVGYPGEPALGPVAFMHRPSALDNPNAPLSHHWAGATHITFGVATLGLRYGNWKLEGSSFTGREPNDERYGFDKPLFDSWSGRLSFNPSKNWALQVSHGFIKSPELLHAQDDVHRTTASAIYSKTLAHGGSWNSTLLWGMNKDKNHDGENAALLETSFRKQRWSLYGRYEWVQKSVEELALDETIYGYDAVFDINAFTVGLNYDIANLGKTKMAVGGQYTLYHANKILDQLYGQNPMAFQVYLRFYPSMMKM